MNKGAPIIIDSDRDRRRTVGWTRKLVAISACLLVVSYVCWATGAIDEQTRIDQARLDISRIEHAVRLFRADSGRCPDGFEELLEPPSKRFYLEEIKDPWSEPYQLICPGRLDPGGAEVISGGPDRNLSGNDNVSSL